jgi:hypothetical protein
MSGVVKPTVAPFAHAEIELESAELIQDNDTKKTRLIFTIRNFGDETADTELTNNLIVDNLPSGPSIPESLTMPFASHQGNRDRVCMTGGPEFTAVQHQSQIRIWLVARYTGERSREAKCYYVKGEWDYQMKTVSPTYIGACASAPEVKTKSPLGADDWAMAVFVGAYAVLVFSVPAVLVARVIMGKPI